MLTKDGQEGVQDNKEMINTKHDKYRIHMERGIYYVRRKKSQYNIIINFDEGYFFHLALGKLFNNKDGKC